MLSSLGVAPVSDVLSSISSVNSLTPEQSMNHTPENSLQPNSNQVIRYVLKYCKTSLNIYRKIHIRTDKIIMQKCLI